MKILLDMNLSPDWVGVLNQSGFDAVHWSAVGDPSATDQVIMQWASTNGFVVLTHDLDFGAILAATGGQGPSVMQFRTQNLLSADLQKIAIVLLRQYQVQLEQGALIIIDEKRSRVRLLPLIAKKN